MKQVLHILTAIAFIFSTNVAYSTKVEAASQSGKGTCKKSVSGKGHSRILVIACSLNGVEVIRIKVPERTNKSYTAMWSQLPSPANCTLVKKKGQYEIEDC